MKPTGPTPAIIFGPDGLNFKRISDIYLESHTVLYGRSRTSADIRVNNALDSKLERETKWTKKNIKNGTDTSDHL